MPLARLLQQIAPAEALFSGSAHGAGVERILQAVRLHLRMDVAFASHVTATETVIRYCDAEEQAPFGAGDAFPVDEGYCKRILDGRIPPLILDAAALPEVADLACTKEMGIGAHISVPLVLSDGSVYGTFCCFSFQADYSLTARDVEMMRAFADLAAAQIEAELTLSSRQASVVEQISNVIERDNLTMVYQPIYSLATNEVIGVEALARFPDKERRGPAEWFAEAAELGLGQALELAALRAALGSQSQLPDDVYLAINASPELILGGQLSKLLKNVPTGRVVLEVTEHAIVQDIAGFQKALGPLRAKVRVAVDDAGAGYSGLRQILDVRPDIIKLDMSLTRNIDRDVARRALTTALIAFSRDIGCQIVAEGVETAGELETLKRLGTHCAQGYHLQRPKPLPALSQFLIARRLGCHASANFAPKAERRKRAAGSI
jgi:EAL domain-containing protein (putative c-di-GMP-specific phosphodiesterase class I)